MAQVDLRNADYRYEDGSSLLAIGLSAAQAQEALADVAATGGWYVVSYLKGGTIGREVSVTDDYDEGNTFLGSVTEQDDFVVVNTVKQTDDQTLSLLKWWETNSAPVRYPLPAGDDGSGNDLHQLHYHPSVRKTIENETMATSRGQQRQLQFTLRGDKNAHVFATVDLTDPDNRPASLANAKDDVFPGALTPSVMALQAVTVQGQVERAGAERMPLPVLQLLAAYYDAGELAEVLPGFDSVHRKRTARAVFRDLRRQGKSADTALFEAGEEVGRSDTWVREQVYGRG